MDGNTSHLSIGVTFVLPKFTDDDVAETSGNHDLNASLVWVVPDQGAKVSSTLDAYRVLVPLLFSIIVLLGVVGNVLVFYVIVSRQKMRHVWNLLLLNLAVADIALLVTCGVFTTVHYVTISWPFGDVFCRVMQYCVYVTSYVSVYTLAVVSVVRYYITLHGPLAQLVNSPRNIVVVIVLSWLVCLGSQIPMLWNHGVKARQYGGYNVTECVFVSYDQGRIIALTFFSFGYAIPLLVIGTMYTLLVIHVKSKTSGVEKVKKPSQRQRHLSRILASVTLLFGICWLPLHLHLLLGYFKLLPNSLPVQILTVIWTALVFVNSALNPLLYNCLSAEFREAFREVLCGKVRTFQRSFRFSSLRSRSTTTTSTSTSHQGK